MHYLKPTHFSNRNNHLYPLLWCCWDWRFSLHWKAFAVAAPKLSGSFGRTFGRVKCFWQKIQWLKLTRTFPMSRKIHQLGLQVFFFAASAVPFVITKWWSSAMRTSSSLPASLWKVLLLIFCFKVVAGLRWGHQQSLEWVFVQVTCILLGGFGAKGRSFSKSSLFFSFGSSERLTIRN